MADRADEPALAGDLGVAGGGPAAAAEAGHQPWTLVAAQVAGQYVQQVPGWGGAAQPIAVGPQVYQFAAGTRLAVVTVRQPLGRPGTVWIVASSAVWTNAG